MLSSQLLRQFVENDNNKIVSSVKRIYYFCNKFFFKKKQEYFYDFCAKIYKSSINDKFHTNKKERNFFNRLFNDSKKKQKILDDLEKKIYKDEEKICTFSPKINSTKIKKYKTNKLFEIITNNPQYPFSMKSSNTTINNNLNDKYNQYMNFNIKFAKTNPLFYLNNNSDKIIFPVSYNSKNNHNSENRKDNNLSFNLMNQKNQIYKKNNKKIDLFNIKYYNYDNSYFEENGFENKTSRNFCRCLKKYRTTSKNNSAVYVNDYNGKLNCEINRKINKNNKNRIPKINKNKLKGNKSKTINKYENNLKDFISINTSSLNNLDLNNNNFYKKSNKRTVTNIPSSHREDIYYLIEKNFGKNIENFKTNSFINRNEYFEIKNNKNKSLNDINNIERIEKLNNKSKRANSLQKYNSFNRIPNSMFTCKNNNYNDNIFYENIKSNNKTIESQSETNNRFHKKSKSLNSNRIFNEVSPFSLKDIIKNNTYNEYNSYENNNYINTNSNELNNENEINIYINKDNANKTLNAKEYYYTFRKGKIPYNSFNYLSNRKSKNNSLQSNKKNNNMNSQKPVSLKADKNKVYFYSAHYDPELVRTNRIYLNNYNKKICRIKKDNYNTFQTNNNSFHNNYHFISNNSSNYKGSFCELTSKKDITRQISNTYYNTNNDTKGCSISSYSINHTKSPKENQSIKNNSSRHEYNNSITNSRGRSINNSLSKQSLLNMKKIKKKKNLRKYINSFNNNMENMIKIPHKKKGLSYYCNNEEKKNDNEIISKNENKKYEVDSNVVNECYINKDNIMNNNKNMKLFMNGSNNNKNENMTLQSLSDSKMMELAEHYINNDEDSLDQLDLRLIQFKKNIKNEKTYRDITFG